jgi:hypothetical protein
MFEGSVPGFFGLVGKAASGKLAAFEVVADALTANPLARAGFVAAIAGFEIFFFLTLHRGSPFRLI